MTESTAHVERHIAVSLVQLLLQPARELRRVPHGLQLRAQGVLGLVEPLREARADALVAVALHEQGGAAAEGVLFVEHAREPRQPRHHLLQPCWWQHLQAAGAMHLFGHATESTCHQNYGIMQTILLHSWQRASCLVTHLNSEYEDGHVAAPPR
jgi:hypothetical protein